MSSAKIESYPRVTCRASRAEQSAAFACSCEGYIVPNIIALRMGTLFRQFLEELA